MVKMLKRALLAVSMTFLAAVLVIVVAVDPESTGADGQSATAPTAPPKECAPPDACWGAFWEDAAREPCWRAIEAGAAEIGRWRWRGIGRLSHHASLPNGNVVYLGERMQIVGRDGLERSYSYACVWFPDTREALLSYIEPGPLR